MFVPVPTIAKKAAQAFVIPKKLTKKLPISFSAQKDKTVAEVFKLYGSDKLELVNSPSNLGKIRLRTTEKYN